MLGAVLQVAQGKGRDVVKGLACGLAERGVLVGNQLVWSGRLYYIVEIDAGDTYAYGNEAQKSKKERESKAKERIYSLLPDDQKEELSALFDEFDKGISPEAKFAHAMDNLQPLILNNSNNGCDWRTHGIKSEQVIYLSFTVY